jgi:opacity protein-like surface antigen
MFVKKLIIASAMLGFMSSVAAAQSTSGLYGGVGFFYGDLNSEITDASGFSGTGSSEVNPSGLAFVFGNKWDQGTYSIGFELGGDISLDGDTDGRCGAGATGAYMCEHKVTLRLRGIISKQFGSVEVFGALGLGMALGDFATSPIGIESASVKGVSIGAGASFPINAKVSIRGEVNYDDFGSSSQSFGFSSEYDAVSARVLAIYKF